MCYFSAVRNRGSRCAKMAQQINSGINNVQRSGVGSGREQPDRWRGPISGIHSLRRHSHRYSVSSVKWREPAR